MVIIGNILGGGGGGGGREVGSVWGGGGKLSCLGGSLDETLAGNLTF